MHLNLKYQTSDQLILTNLVDSASKWFEYSVEYVYEYLVESIDDNNRKYLSKILEEYKPIRAKIGWDDNFYRCLYEKNVNAEYPEISQLISMFEDIKLKKVHTTIGELVVNLAKVGEKFVEFASKKNDLYTEYLKPFYTLVPESDISKQVACYVGVSPNKKYTASALRKSMILEIPNDPNIFERFLFVVMHEFVHVSFNTASLIKLDENNRAFWETMRNDIARRNIELVDEGFAYYLTEVGIGKSNYKKIYKTYQDWGLKQKNTIKRKNMLYTAECINAIGENLKGEKIDTQNRELLSKKILTSCHKILSKE